MQCVWLWGIGQEIIEADKVFEIFETKSKVYQGMSEEEKKILKLRLKAPYPLLTKIST